MNKSPHSPERDRPLIMKMNVLLLAVTCLLPFACSKDFNISLELQGGNCSDQLTLICRHSNNGAAPLWVHNETVESGETLATAFEFPGGAEYSVQIETEHIVIVSGEDNVQRLDGYVIQCAYNILGSLTKSNAIKFSFIPNDFQPKLMMTSVFQSFSGSFCTLNYTVAGYTAGITKYPNCTNQFSVDFTVTPFANISASNVSTGDVRLYNITNLERCRIYDNCATSLRGGQPVDTVYTGDTVMTSPGKFTVANVTFVSSVLSIITIEEVSPDCPLFPTRWYNIAISEVNDTSVQKGHVVANSSSDSIGSVTILTVPFDTPLPQGMLVVEVFKVVTVPVRELNATGSPVNTADFVEWNSTSKVTGVFNPHLPPETIVPVLMNPVGPVIGAVVAAVLIGSCVICLCLLVIFICRKKTKRSYTHAIGKPARKQNMYVSVDRVRFQDIQANDVVREEEGTGSHALQASVTDAELDSPEVLQSTTEDEWAFSSDWFTQSVMGPSEDGMVEETHQSGALRRDELKQNHDTDKTRFNIGEEPHTVEDSMNELADEHTPNTSSAKVGDVVTCTVNEMVMMVVERTTMEVAVDSTIASSCSQTGDDANTTVNSSETLLPLHDHDSRLEEAPELLPTSIAGVYGVDVECATQPRSSPTDSEVQMADDQPAVAKSSESMVDLNLSHNADIDFNKKGTIPAPKNELSNVQYAENEEIAC